MHLEHSRLKLQTLHPRQKLNEKRQRTVDAENTLRSLMERHLTKEKHRLALCAERMKGLSPLEKLSQGYSPPIGILSSDGYVIERALELCDAFVFCGGARFYPYHFEVMDYAARSGKPVLGICLGMQMMNTYFLVAEEAQRRGWSGTLLALFDQMKKERYMFTEPVDGHWNGHITRDSVDSFKHPIRVESGSRIEHLLGGPEILGASMHNYRITHPAAALRVTGRTADGTIEALEYGDQMLGVQFHPEADATSDALFQMICR